MRVTLLVTGIPISVYISSPIRANAYIASRALWPRHDPHPRGWWLYKWPAGHKSQDHKHDGEHAQLPQLDRRHGQQTERDCFLLLHGLRRESQAKPCE